MNPSTVQHLIELNRQFYQTFARSFSQTRQRLQPGVRRLMPCLLSGRAILDLGCGNGELILELLEQGYQGMYWGLDFSQELIEIATHRLQEKGYLPSPRIFFTQADLSDENWTDAVGTQRFDRVVAFAVLHHIPAAWLRCRISRQAVGLLQGGKGEGFFIHSNWQFLNSPRYQARIMDWSLIGLTQDDVEEGDYLLDWRRDGAGLRYVHHFSPDEMEEYLRGMAVHICDRFYSDGKEGNLAYYEVWQI